MTNNFSAITSDDLLSITGGAGPSGNTDFASIRQQAAQYCPQTAARYAGVNPSTVTRGKAQQMGNECVAEISPMLRGIARGRIDSAIDQAFPARK
jgi:hypothetical protein